MDIVQMFWEAIGRTSSVATLVDVLRAIVQDISDRYRVQELERLYSEIDFSSLPADLYHCQNYIDRYIEQKKGTLINEKLFTVDEKNSFYSNFFEKNSNMRPYKSYIEPILVKYLDCLENLLSNKMSAGEKLIYNRLSHTGRMLEAISSRLDETYSQRLKSVYTANKQYVDSFQNELFLHKGSGTVNLVNLFVLQKYTELTYFMDKKTDLPDLSARLAQFIQQEDCPFMFIEGDAGTGKSSLVAWMNYHYYCQDDIADQLFKQKDFFTIRLRDLNKGIISSSQSLIPAILDYMHLSSVDALEKIFQDAIAVLDGFDELCMIDNILNYEELIYDLSRRRPYRYKFIITTRPKYIRLGKINVVHQFISLQHFDDEKRMEWLKKYTNPALCNQSIEPLIKQYIENIKDTDASGICDTPMSLYLLVAKKISTDALQNIWMLYHQIFYSEISETEYNRMFPDPNKNYAHQIIKHRDTIYRISEEIAYHMYCTGNSRLFLSADELAEIIDKLSREDRLLENIDIRFMAERCYALCSYWKADSDSGMLEFYHNNIRDFFLCEKIFREMNQIYRMFEKPALEHDLNSDITNAINKFCELFRFGTLETMVGEFLLSRTICGKTHNRRDFPINEAINHRLPDLFQTMLTHPIYSIPSKNPIRTISNILACVVQIYRYTYEPFLKEGDTIRWWHSVSAINENGMLGDLFRWVFCHSPIDSEQKPRLTMASRGDFSGLDFMEGDLRNTGFQGANLTQAKLKNTILPGCDLSYSILKEADFTGADMHSSKFQNADMTQCILLKADLRNIDLSGCDLSGCDLSDCILSKCIFAGCSFYGSSLAGCDLAGCDLSECDLSHANLAGANLTGAYLRNTKLPPKEVTNEQI